MNTELQKLTRQEIIDRLAYHVHEAALRSAFGQDSSTHDDTCGALYAECVRRGEPDLYDIGWKKGVGA